MSRANSIQFTGGFAFPIATAGGDAFKKEDLEGFAAGLDWHDHSLGLGYSVLGTRVYVVTSRAYGATGLGVLDDAPAINLAITTAAAAGGGTVDLPPGTYLCQSSIVLKNNVTLRGHGDQTILVPAVNANFSVIDSTAGVVLSNARVETLFINGQGVSGLTSTNHGVRLHNPTRCHIFRCRIRSVGGDGVQFPPWNSTAEEHLNWIVHNLIEIVLGHGIHVMDNNPDTTIALNEVGGSGYAAFPDPSGYGSGSTFDGISLENSGGSQKVSTNHVHQSSRYNYNLNGSGDVLLTGNMSEKSAKSGIVVQSENGNTISGNRVRQTGQDGSTSDCILVVDSNANCISGNRLSDGRYGVSISRSAAQIITDNQVFGNNCFGCVTAPVYLQVGGEVFGNSPSRSGAVPYGFRRALNGIGTVAIASMNNDTITTVSLNVPGAIMGDPVIVGFENIGSNAVAISAQVISNDTVLVTLFNQSGGTLTYGTQTWRAVVFQV